MGAAFFVNPDARQQANDMQAALKHHNTRRVFRRLLAWSNVMGQSWDRDAACASYNEGLRAVGLWLAQQIEQATPGELAALMRESAEEYQVWQTRKQKGE